MKKTFAVVLLISGSLTACGGKKDAATTPAQPAMEQKGDATGGAAYGKKADGAAPTPVDDKASPNAPK